MKFRIFEDDDLRYRILRQILAQIVKKGEDRILDVGCGEAKLALPYSVTNDMLGLDVDVESLSKAKQNGIHTALCDIEKTQLPLQDDKYDIAICSEALEHVTNTDHLLQEINRVLKVNGVLVLSVPNINNPLSIFLQVFLDLPPVYSARYKSPHKRDFTLRLVREALKINGFRIEKITGTCIPPLRNTISQVLAWLFPRFSSKIIVTSRKITKPKPSPETLVVWNDSDW